MTPVIRIDDQVMEELKKQAVNLGLVFEPPNATLRRVLGLDMDGDSVKPLHKKARKVRLEELVSKGLLSDGKFLYFYHTRLFTNERAQVITSSNQLKYEGDGHLYSVSKLAKVLLKKHGFKHDELDVRGPIYWKTEDGKLLHELNEQIRKERDGKT